MDLTTNTQMVNNKGLANRQHVSVSHSVQDAAKSVLAGIQKDALLSRADWFSRETLLVHFKDHPYFGRVSTISRYTLMRAVVTYLVLEGSLVRPDNSHTRLCLPRNLGRYKRFVREGNLDYSAVIGDLVMNGASGTISVMDIVKRWQADKRYANMTSRLTEDNMRVLVRQGLRALARAGTLQENADYTYDIVI